MLGSVHPTVLAQAGIRMLPPTSSAVVNQEEAEQAAVRSMPGHAVREAVLTDLSDTHHVPAINTLAWAISLRVPPGWRAASAGPWPGRAAMKPSYLVVFIDAVTGRSSWPPAADDFSLA